MVDNQGTETPQAANDLFDESVFEAPQEGSTQDNTLTPTDAFTEPSGEEAPKEAPSTQETSQPLDARNDDTRYEYWQSQAAKRENEIKQMQMQMQQVQTQVGQQAPQQAPVQERETFPEAPPKPVRPRAFNRQEAYEDSSSESARYLDEVDEWRDTMDEYTSLKGQYDNALLQEQLENQRTNQAQAERVRQAQIQQASQMQEVSNLVQGHYGMSPQETQDFVKTMSDPSSITVDNLVQLYRMQKGSGASPTNTGQPTQPSSTFQQTQRAQQVPQPMGVQPTAGNNQAPAEDQIMDNIISDYKKNNPW